MHRFMSFWILILSMTEVLSPSAFAATPFGPASIPRQSPQAFFDARIGELASALNDQRLILVDSTGRSLDLDSFLKSPTRSFRIEAPRQKAGSDLAPSFQVETSLSPDASVAKIQITVFSDATHTRKIASRLVQIRANEASKVVQAKLQGAVHALVRDFEWSESPCHDRRVSMTIGTAVIIGLSLAFVVTLPADAVVPVGAMFFFLAGPMWASMWAEWDEVAACEREK